MSKLEKYDKNMLAGTAAQADNSLVFPDCFAPPFRLSGFYWYQQDHMLHRLPAHIAGNVSEAVGYLATKTAGGTLSFRTNSKRLYLEAVVTEATPSVKFGACGKSGFDIYMRREDQPKLTFVKTALPEPCVKRIALDIPDFDALYLNGNSPMVEVLINFPPYDGVDSFRLGLEADAQVLPPTPYAVEKPVLFYGSSITQGGCASRPGNAYINHLGRRLNIHCINFGFSGSGKAEPLMAETIAQMQLQAFVMDYDHNAPNVEYLQNTHEPFFQTIRKAQPDLPIIMISRPGGVYHPVIAKRKQVIRTTYENAIAAGDTKVWFIDGEALLNGPDRDACTIDGTHPNDIGFLRMADGIEPILRQALQL